MRRRRAVAIAVVLAIVAGCAGDDDGNDAGEQTIEDATTDGAETDGTGAAFEPSFETDDCVAAVRDDERVGRDNPRLECGWLTVLEDRNRPDGATIRLPVVRLRSDDPERRPDPVVFLEGGPGGATLDNVGRWLERDLGPRDVILFDQRGTGSAEPSLDCPEVVDAVWEALGAAAPAAAERERAVDALLACRERLEIEGVDFGAYDTEASAADVADLRTAMGIEEWNLFGESYGTTLALATMRAHPRGIRSVVLDSVYPTTVGAGFEHTVAIASRAFDALAEGCAADVACAAAHPDLLAELDEVRDRYNAAPIEADVDDPLTSERRHIVITGDDVVAGAWSAMYDSALIPLLPSLLAQLRNGDTGLVPELARRGVSRLVGTAEAMGISVHCADRQSLVGEEDVEEIADSHPRLAGLLALDTTPCDLWDVPSAPEAFNEPVESDIPTLVLAGEYDPVTPPADGREVAEELERATFVELPALGHGVAFAHECPESIVRRFLDQPTVRPALSCVDAMGPPAWVP